MKKSLLSAALLAVTSYAVQSAPADYSRLEKEIEIVKGIVDTSLKQQRDGKGMRYRSLDAIYLANQGVVFTVNTSGSGNWVAQISSMVGNIPPIPPVPDVPVIVHGGEMDIELSREWEAFADETASRFEEAFAESSERIHDLRSDERELAWEKRDNARRKRDLEFELSQADGEREKEIKQELKELDKELDKLAQKEQKVKARVEEIEKKRNEDIAARQKARMEDTRAFLANFESGVGDALCRFGGGMRALPANQNITFVLKDFSRDDSRQTKDRIYVFSKNQINDCVKEKINTDTLLKEANIYDF